MKNKILMIAIAVFLILPSIFILAACDIGGLEGGSNCSHEWEISTQPTEDKEGNAICRLCSEDMVFPKLNSSDYQVDTTNPDYKIYSCIKYNTTYTFAASNFHVSFNGSGCTISGYFGNKTEIVVPEKVILDQKQYDVTIIDTFMYVTPVTSITLPSSLKRIEGNAFNNCTDLKNVYFAEGLEVIGDSAFFNCGMTEIVIPDSVTEIQANAFKNCSSLEKVIIGDGLNVINNEVFQGCTSLEEIIIGNGVEEIKEGVFRGCSSLSKINFGSSVGDIYVHAFENCTSIQEIIVPMSVEYIDHNAFKGCSALNKVYYKGNGRTCYFLDTFDGLDGRIKADIYYYCEEEPTPYVCMYEIFSTNLWHFDVSGDIKIWNIELTNNALNKTFVYSKTEVTITDEQWESLQQANLEEIFANEEERELVTSSSSKEEYKSKLEAYGSGGYFSFIFNNDVEDKRVVVGSGNMSYIEINGSVCVLGHTYVQVLTMNQDSTELYYEIDNEYMAIKHIYTLYVPED